MFEQLRLLARRLPDSAPAVPGRTVATGHRRRRSAYIARSALLLAFPLGFLAAGFAEAACEKSRRISHRDAECLSAEWNNRGVFKKNSYRVRNMCPDYGKVVAKVDLKMARDRTLHLNDGSARTGRTGHRIGSISCCPDIGDLCNRSDAVTAEGCVARFKRSSSAALTCAGASAVPAISGDDYRCTVTALCKRDPRLTGGLIEWRRTSVTVDYTGMGEVRNCDGRLKNMPCGAGLSVGDAVARDGSGWSLLFSVTLPGPQPEIVRVDYATSDGTAMAGVDYVATRGTLTFAPGETSKTVTVEVIHDERPEHSKRMHLTLSNPRGAPIFHATAMGTIFDLPVYRSQRWLSGFARAVAGALVDRLGGRLTANDSGSRVAPGGHRIRLTATPTDAGREHVANGDPTRHPENGRASGAGVRAMSGRAFLLDSSFLFATGNPDDANGRWSGWGEAASMRFGQGGGGSDGFIGLVGADYERGRLLSGVAVSRSGAEGSGVSDGVYGLRATLDSVHPYARLALSDELSVWSALGFGTGDLALNDGFGSAGPVPPRHAEIGFEMAAVGMRGALLSPEKTDGFALSVKSDAYLARITSEAFEAEGSRLRLLLEGAHGFALGPDRRLTLSVEAGLRHEGGDGAAGTGVATGGALRYAAPGLDVAAEIGNGDSRGAAPGPWQASVSVLHEPRAAERGVRVSVSPSWEVQWGGKARPEHRFGIQGTLPLGPD